jgi:enoyl-CoA hydratase/carnithine racemase
VSDDVVLYELRDAVAVITLNRPDRLNAWSPDLEVAYGRCLDRAAEEPDVRAVVVTGAGRGFCAGADTDVLRRHADREKVQSGERRKVYEFEPAVPKPVIAAVNGACAGIGLTHAMLCDVRFTARDAKWTTAFVRRGVPAEQGAAWLLQRLVGYSRAADLLLSGRVVDGEEAHRIGLADHLAEGPVVDAAVAYAADIARWCSPSAMATIKTQLQQSADGTFASAYEAAMQLASQVFGSADFREGVRSYLERREPRFAGIAR